MNYRSLVTVAGLATLATGCADRASAMQQPDDAAAFLSHVRGADPVVCELVGHALRNTWGRGSVTPVLRVPGQTEETVALVRWAHQAHEQSDMIPTLRAALDEPDACVRATAARLFDHTRDRRRAVSVLTDALRSSNATTQHAAAMALGYVEDRAAVGALVERMTSRDVEMRLVVAWALGEIEHPDAIPALVRALDDADVGVRGNAAWALGRIERSAAVGPLADALGDPEVSVRVNAAWALGQIEDAAAIPALSEVLQRDQNAEVRRAAAWALGKIE